MAEQRPSGNAEQPVCTFLFRKPGRRGAAGRRKRARSEAEAREGGGGSGSSSSGDEGGAGMRPERKRAAPTASVQKTRGGGRARAAGGRGGGGGEPSRGGEERPGPEPEGPGVLYQAARPGPEDAGATAAYAPDGDGEREARAFLEAGQRVRQQLLGAAHDGLFRGPQGYPQGLAPGDGDAAPANAASGLLPIRAPEHLRAAVRWDYQPAICKEFLESGFCGFGDGCGFLHDRSGHEQAGLMEPQPGEGQQMGPQQMEPQPNEGGGDGMQIERRQLEPQPNEGGGDGMQIERRQLENQQVEPQQNEGGGGGGDDDDGSFHCFFCRQPFRDPVVTKCHFCEVCVLARYRTNPRCYLCDHHTQGTSQAPALPCTPHVSVPK